MPTWQILDKSALAVSTSMTTKSMSVLLLADLVILRVYSKTTFLQLFPESFQILESCQQFRLVKHGNIEFMGFFQLRAGLLASDNIAGLLADRT